MNARDRVVPPYLKVCRDAATNPEVFRTFKIHPHYSQVLEHLSKELGQRHWENINYSYFTEQNINDMLMNDIFGNPRRFRFGAITASPTTIQYINVLSNLITEFGDMTGFRIAEIGGGYGGQAKIIKDKFRIPQYDIIDLPEVILLQEKYLKELNRAENVHFFTNENYKEYDLKYDLFISNYAVSEVNAEDQLAYVEEIMLHCARGYITCNQPLNGLDLLRHEHRSLRILPDIAGERKENYVIIWGYKE